MINLPTIQIILPVDNLKIYYQEVKEKRYAFPDFSDHCPLCGGKDCARFLVFYTRHAVDEKGTYYKAFPIARYKCYRKGRKKVSHRTFSLLPHQLVPYTKYSIEFIMKTLEILSMDNATIDDVLNYVSRFGKNDILSISSMKVVIFKGLGLEAIEKILVSGYYNDDISGRFNNQDIKQRLRAFIGYAGEFCCHKTDSPIRGPCGLSYDFYLQSGSYYNNAHFLFGTPSQFRS